MGEVALQHEEGESKQKAVVVVDVDDEEESQKNLLVASLASRVLPQSFTRAALLSALDKNGENVARAADTLLLGSESKTDGHTKKRKQFDLDSWLGKSGPSTISAATSPIKKKSKEVEVIDVDAENQKKFLSLEMLRPPAGSSTPRPATNSNNIPGLYLPNAESLAQHLPSVTLAQPSPLSTSFASALFYELVQESKSFMANKWMQKGKEVSSPHTAVFYARRTHDTSEDELAQTNSMWYDGKPSGVPRPFPTLLQKASFLVEEAVNESIETNRRGKRYVDEWKGKWRANVCVVNMYNGTHESLGQHSDQMTYLGPNPTIASLTLGVTRNFRLRPTLANKSTPIRNYDIPLQHNTLLIMNPPTNDLFKHGVPAMKGIDVFKPKYDIKEFPIDPDFRESFNCRINITFRFHRPDFSPLPGINSVGKPRLGTPMCKCDIPCLLRADQKGKVAAQRAAAPSSPFTTSPTRNATRVGASTTNSSEGGGDLETMIYFWQCNGGASTDGVGCGFFRLLDMTAEGRGF